MSDDIRLTLKIHGQTARSLLVSKTGEDRSVWIRRSEIRNVQWLDESTVQLILPLWLARTERLI